MLYLSFFAFSPFLDVHFSVYTHLILFVILTTYIYPYSNPFFNMLTSYLFSWFSWVISMHITFTFQSIFVSDSLWVIPINITFYYILKLSVYVKLLGKRKEEWKKTILINQRTTASFIGQTVSIPQKSLYSYHPVK